MISNFGFRISDFPPNPHRRLKSPRSGRGNRVRQRCHSRRWLNPLPSSRQDISGKQCQGWLFSGRAFGNGPRSPEVPGIPIRRCPQRRVGVPGILSRHRFPGAQTRTRARKRAEHGLGFYSRPSSAKVDEPPQKPIDTRSWSATTGRRCSQLMSRRRPISSGSWLRLISR